MGGDISLAQETNDPIIFNEGEFEKQWKKTGLASESMWNFFKSSYEELVMALLRPMADQGKNGRACYDAEALGPTRFNLCEKWYTRDDFEIVNKRNLKLVCSHWSLAPESGASASREGVACVLYLHSTVGSRVEALQALVPSLRAGCSFLAFDFSGSGLSEGEYVTWGWFENNDVVDMVQHMHKTLGYKKVVFWGRNLGAATALFYAAKDPRIKGLVLDTPFSSFEETLAEGVKFATREGATVPRVVMKAAQAMIVRALRSRISPNFSTAKLCPKTVAKKCKQPALFAAAQRDIYIPRAQVEGVFKAYAGKKKDLTTVDLRFYDSRRYRTCCEFLVRCEEFISATVGSARLPLSEELGSPMNPRELEKDEFAWTVNNIQTVYRIQEQLSPEKRTVTADRPSFEVPGPESHFEDEDDGFKVAIEQIIVPGTADGGAEESKNVQDE